MSEGNSIGTAGRGLHVVAVCCGQGFPNGMAVSYRLKMVGLGLLSQGARFSLFHVGGSPFENPSPDGEWRGIRYRYFPARTKHEPVMWRRRLANASGLLAATAALARERRAGTRPVVYSAGFHSWENRLLAASGAPVVPDISEWYATGWSARSLRRRLSPLSGAVVISRGIESRIARVRLPGGRALPTLRVPILFDLESDGRPGAGPVFEAPYLLWTGDPRGEIGDHLLFLVRMAARVTRDRPSCRLVLIGCFDVPMRRSLAELARRESGRDDWLVIHGFVPKEQLATPVAGASVLLAPLPPGVRWECCFPTKLGEYLASGRPVISSPVGEVGAYLRDGENAALAPSGDVEAHAAWAIRLLDDPELARRIGAAGRALAIREFDYRIHSRRLFEFLDGMAGGGAGAGGRAV